MKLSTRIRYGTRALVSIAALSQGRPVPLTEIARVEQISKKYLESIIASLKKAGLVESVRGAVGGYIVKKRIENITLIEIVNALGGPINIIDCIGDSAGCTNRSACALYEIWEDVNTVIKEKLESITLTEIVDIKRKRFESGNAKTKDMYYI